MENWALRALPNTGNLPSTQALSGKVRELQSTVAQQAKTIDVLTAQVKEQAAQIQKVSAQLEVNKPAAQVVSYGQ
jgi:cell division protein FtsB